ncbi:biopolymer transporter ExbB [Leisingera caerulea]|uniref:Biopolymer transporter ExbB n=1 Tax=Leisingera caerulea TaxID=506591 RepID=A0A9Q9M3P0_LEICA|nr:biopolymer transporter ExbB [Leisingera caerulea]UWQ50719.1 biopolymer transporter ExbB [Leisingera caerulea]UWQ54788.1 biopolymer transporter ExbB [Leisingera caerulea]UWQ59411.1 biopolymer transporter ExbB [Leisingera caerulea]UWQ63541.1 biopolymer transporter ExbB [Leisingera caerulea]UWQ84443.1 biopolymer transporter ExbB [Leisingera caerulea]
MAQPDRKTRPQFSQPVRQIIMMLIALGLSGFGAFVALPRVLPVFQANPWLNGFIVFVFVIGVLACFWQVVQLIGSVRWIERFAAGDNQDHRRPPSMLAPLASLLATRSARMQLGSASTRSILDSVASRIDEDREITRYIVNLLIFLGLLGTFYGLATTVPAVVDTIRSLAPQEGEEGLSVFNRLMTGLEAQLGGMGVAFASSLLGLAGSLIVGLLELFAGHGQNRFYRELEEWLSSITRVSFSSGEDGAGDSGVVSQVLDNMAEQMDALQAMFAETSEGRAAVDQKLGALVETIQEMNQRQEQTGTITAALDRVAVGQEALTEILRAQGEQGAIDAESRMRLRSIDVQMLRILEEISAGRQESLAELRKDIDLMIKAFARPRGLSRGGLPGRDAGE